MLYLRIVSMAMLTLTVGCGHMETRDCSSSESNREPAIQTQEDAPGISPAPGLGESQQGPREEVSQKKKCPVEVRYYERREFLGRGGRQ